MHPVMNKFQAHMALAAASQSQHNKLKNQQNYGFTPPSQVMSSYSNFGPATSSPYWHMGFMKNNNPFQVPHDNRDFHHHFHQAQVAKPQHQHHQNQQHQQSQHQQPQQQQHQQQQHQQQQSLPNVHPSVITPFLDQVRLKQKEAGAEQKNAFKQSHEVNSQENNGPYEVINDIFSKHLVPPLSTPVVHIKPKPFDKLEKANKYNLSMPSPLQDASRFNYNHIVSTATPASNDLRNNFRPSASDNTYRSTEKPNVFINLNRTKENVYKQHKLLHPSYTGGQRVKPSVSVSLEKPFLPTPYRPEKEEEEVKYDYKPPTNFFTIEDAVTPHLSYEIVKSHIPVEEEPEVDVYTFPKRPEYEYSTQEAYKTSEPTAAPIESSSQKPRQKLRRRKPKPQQKQQQQQQQQEQKQQQVVKEPTEVHERITEKPTYKPNRLRGSIKNADTQTEQSDLRTRNRVNHPSRVRNRFNVSSTASTSTTADLESTAKAFTEEENTPPLRATTENYSKIEESSEQPENVKRRVRLRFKNKLRSNAMETANFKPKLNDNQIADTENENFVIKQSDETTEPTATESGLNEIRLSFKLPNSRLRNEGLTTLPTTADTVSTSIEPSSTKGIEPEETNVLNKIANRPRFSIKEYKRKQLTTSSVNTPLSTTSTTVVTTTKPDNQRFNRLRLNLNRRRNETTEPERSGDEDYEVPRKRYSSTRFSPTTDAPTQTSSSPKRGSLPKRTFSTRNFTKPTVNLNESEMTTRQQIKVSTTNRPASPSLRSRIQNYKKKQESSNEVTDSPQDAIKNINFSAETSVTQEQPTTVSTEPPAKHETSIMKIAKTPPSVHVEKSTATNSVDDNTSITSSTDFDLAGSPSEYSQRVAELTFSGNDVNFKSANIGTLSRRIPNYFTISTDDPILPIQAFFPNVLQERSSRTISEC